jgi:hypothetical protein
MISLLIHVKYITTERFRMYARDSVVLNPQVCKVAILVLQMAEN